MKVIYRQRDGLDKVLSTLQRLSNPSSNLIEASLPEGSSLLKLSDISFIAARDKQVYARCAGRDWTIRQTLKDLELSLPPQLFQRVSKSEIINLSYLSRFDLARGGVIIAVLRDGSTHKTTSSYIDAIMQRIIGS